METLAELTILDQRLKLNEKDPNGIEVIPLRADTSFWQLLDADGVSRDEIPIISWIESL